MFSVRIARRSLKVQPCFSTV